MPLYVDSGDADAVHTQAGADIYCGLLHGHVVIFLLIPGAYEKNTKNKCWA